MGSIYIRLKQKVHKSFENQLNEWIKKIFESNTTQKINRQQTDRIFCIKS